jgi:hypothetical protein
MRRNASTRSAIAFICASALAITTAGIASAEPKEVDESRLVPSLSASFAPWDCKLKRTGPVCTGERHLFDDWAPVDWPCSVQLYNQREENRFSTRYYNHDYLNYDRRLRSNDVDRFSTSPDGPAQATISTTIRFQEPFAVPGDDSTFTVITEGVIWDIRGDSGPAVFRAVGTLIERPDGTSSFTGHVTDHGVTTRYVGAALDAFYSDEALFAAVCEAATS